MGRVPIVASALCLAACASTLAPPPRAPLDIVTREVGPDLAAAPRPSEGVVQLSIFVDAGSRDADPPQVAAVAAQLAAERAGEGVTGHAWPDGSELRLRCTTDDAPACVRRLARGLSTRRASAAEVERIVAMLAAQRRQTTASDPARQADQLALRALLDDAADGLFPLGLPDDDPRADADAVSAFLAAHYGPQRALLVSAGELTIEKLTWAATHAFGNNPKATRARSSLDALPIATGATSATDATGAPVLVDIDDSSALSLALVAPDAQRAAAAAAAVRGRLLRQRLARKVQGHVLPLRGGALALLRVDTGRSDAALRAAAHELSLQRIEQPSTTHFSSSDDSLAALVHQAGLRWLTRDGPVVTTLAMGAGATAPGGRSDRPSARDPDAERRQALQQELSTAFAAGVAAAAPTLEGDVAADAADVTLDNGARIAVRRRPSERVSIAVRISVGADQDPPLLHGRSALLATAASTACAGRGPGSLERSLAALDATLEPRVSADSWGLLLDAPSQHAAAATRLALDCALDPWLVRRHVTTARQRARGRLGDPTGDAEMRAAVARALVPEAPGSLAPWGSAHGTANCSLDCLRDGANRSLQGPNLSVAVVGSVDARAVTEAVARRAGILARAASEVGEHVGSAAPLPPTSELGLAAPPADVLQPTFGLLLWQVRQPVGHPAGARAFAALMRDGLGRIAGVTAPWHDGGMLADLGWAAVAVIANAETLAALRAQLDAASGSIDRARLAEASTRAHARYGLAQAAQAARTDVAADSLARQPFMPQLETPPDAAAARALAQSLADSSARFQPLR